jgi:hypothetical protein
MINFVGTTVHGEPRADDVLAMAHIMASSLVVSTRHHSTISRKTPGKDSKKREIQKMLKEKLVITNVCIFIVT